MFQHFREAVSPFLFVYSRTKYAGNLAKMYQYYMSQVGSPRETYTLHGRPLSSPRSQTQRARRSSVYLSSTIHAQGCASTCTFRSDGRRQFCRRARDRLVLLLSSRITRGVGLSLLDLSSARCCIIVLVYLVATSIAEKRNERFNGLNHAYSIIIVQVLRLFRLRQPMANHIYAAGECVI